MRREGGWLYDEMQKSPTPLAKLRLLERWLRRQQAKIERLKWELEVEQSGVDVVEEWISEQNTAVWRQAKADAVLGEYKLLHKAGIDALVAEIEGIKR